MRLEACSPCCCAVLLVAIPDSAPGPYHRRSRFRWFHVLRSFLYFPKFLLKPMREIIREQGIVTCVQSGRAGGEPSVSSQNTELFLILTVFQPSSSLLSERLLQNITVRAAYKQQKLLASSSGGWKSQLRASTVG